MGRGHGEFRRVRARRIIRQLSNDGVRARAKERKASGTGTAFYNAGIFVAGWCMTGRS